LAGNGRGALNREKKRQSRATRQRRTVAYFPKRGPYQPQKKKKRRADRLPSFALSPVPRLLFALCMRLALDAWRAAACCVGPRERGGGRKPLHAANWPPEIQTNLKTLQPGTQYSISEKGLVTAALLLGIDACVTDTGNDVQGQNCSAQEKKSALHAHRLSQSVTALLTRIHPHRHTSTLCLSPSPSFSAPLISPTHTHTHIHAFQGASRTADALLKRHGDVA
jgi:hypothetical protein